ncbi:HipA N-terminal domain-containing protein [bacterium]|nr:HipA N-terminal domain-containing protein [bacterium]
MRLRVYYNEFLAGSLEERKSQQMTTYLFQYEESYLNYRNARPVSVHLPLRKEAYSSNVLFPFFDNLLSEGWLLDLQLNSLKIDRNDRFALISRCGLECVGAVSLRGDDE